MNTKEMLIKAITGVISQDCKSIDLPSDYCLYRGENGAKCAVGHLISDKFYKPSLEANTVDYPTVAKAVELSIGRTLEEHEINKLETLQDCHDTSTNTRNFVADFKLKIKKEVAKGSLPKYCLEVL